MTIMLLWALTFFIVFILLMIALKSNLTWFYGLYQTVSAIALARRPNIFKQLIKEEIKASDGENYVVWWSSKLIQHFSKSIKTNEVSNDNIKSIKRWMSLVFHIYFPFINR